MKFEYVSGTSSVSIIATLYANHLRFSKENDKWLNRDRFILSAGHGSSLLYATLYMAGFPIELSDLESFRCLGSITPGHPEYGITRGVDISTGPLGQGVASSVGIAIGEEYLSNYFGKDIIDYYTYVFNEEKCNQIEKNIIKNNNWSTKQIDQKILKKFEHNSEILSIKNGYYYYKENNISVNTNKKETKYEVGVYDCDNNILYYLSY